MPVNVKAWQQEADCEQIVGNYNDEKELVDV